MKAVKAIQQRETQLIQDRETFDPTWVDIRDNLLPFHGRNLAGCESREDQRGHLKSHKILDGTATRALAVTAAGMQAGINSPARPWFKLGYSDRDLTEWKPVRLWLDQAEQVVRRIYSKSNIYNMLHHTYMELIAFATGAAAIVPDFDTVVRARPFTIGEYWLGLNDKAKVDSFYRKYRLSALQIVSQFGIDNVSQAVRSAYENNRTEETFVVNHFVEPNDDRIKFPFGDGKAFRSVYHEKSMKDGQVLGVMGSEIFPILAPRWHTVGMMAYGFGPGHATLNDIKGLQTEKEKQLMALDKHVDPAMVGPSTLEDEVIDATPGGITYDDSLTATSGLRPLYQTSPNIIQYMTAEIQDTRNAIRAGLFTDLFTMIANSVDVQKTATEVAALKEEKMMVLGPVLDSVHDEVHDPLISAVVHYADMADMLPPPPDEIAGMEMEVEYISILAQAQKLVATTGIEQVAGFVGNLSSVFPEARFKFNATEAIDEYADAVGVSARVINSDQEVAAMQQKEQQQIEAQQQLEAGAASAQQAKVLSETDMGGNNALNALLGQAQ